MDDNIDPQRLVDISKLIEVDLKSPKDAPSYPPPAQINCGHSFAKHFATKENMCKCITGLLSIGSGVGLGYLVIRAMNDRNIRTNIQIKTSQFLGAFIALVLAGAGVRLVVNSVREAINLTRQEVEHNNEEEEEPLLNEIR